MDIRNSHGAVNLDALRGPTPAQQKKLAEATVTVLQKSLLVCPCGEPIINEGVKLFMIYKGIVNTPRGPEPGVQVIHAAFHSRKCPFLVRTLVAKVTDKDPIPLALTPLPPIEWISEKT